MAYHLLTRDQQIRKALKLLAPPPSQRAQCRQDIGAMLDRVEYGAVSARSFRVASSKKGKAGVRRYYAALRRLRSAYNALDPAVRPWFSLTETAYIAGKPTLIDREITTAENFLDRPSPPPRRAADRNKAAVAAAHALLSWWGRKAVVTRGGKWEQLSKILAGDLSVGLFDHLREFKRHPGPIFEKVRGPDGIVYRTRRSPGIKSDRKPS
jgi:hypothetical protein